MSRIIHLSTERFEREVLHSDQPVLVDFHAIWCAPCRMMEPVLHKIAEEFGSRLRVVKVDVDQEYPLAERYGISAVPTLMLFNKGITLERSVGLVSLNALQNMVERVVPSSPLVPT